VQFHRLAVAHARGLDLVVEETEWHASTFVRNPRAELAGPAIAPHAFEARRPTERLRVAQILSRRADPQVAPPVVQRVAIDMVDDHARRGFHDHPVHGDVASVTIAVRVDPAVLARGAPSVSAEPVVIGRVDDRELALGQGDVPNVLAWRLGRRRPDLAASTSRAKLGARSVGLDGRQLARLAGCVRAGQA
jgi:hypothetical protein